MLNPNSEQLSALRRQIDRLKPDDFNGKYRINGNVELALFYKPGADIVRGKNDYQDRWYVRGGSGIGGHQARNYTESFDAALEVLATAKLNLVAALERIRAGRNSVAWFVEKGFTEKRALALAILSLAITELQTAAEQKEAGF